MRSLTVRLLADVARVTYPALGRVFRFTFHGDGPG
jgi:hypothetical protein